MVLKYIVPGYPTPTLYFGVANVIANGLIMLRYAFSRPQAYPSDYSSADVTQLCRTLGFAEYGG